VRPPISASRDAAKRGSVALARSHM
jgi:hypothetical protein